MKRILTGIVFTFLSGGVFASSVSEKTVTGVEPLAHIYDLETLLVDCQDQFLPIAPPDENVYLHSGNPVLPVEWDQFPQEFKAGMMAEIDENEFPLYRVSIYEDAATRETVFLNGLGVEVYRLAPVQDYNPYAYQMNRLGITSFAEFEPYYEWIYDPAKIATTYQLIPTQFYEGYQAIQTEIRAEEAEIRLQEELARKALEGPEVLTDVLLEIKKSASGVAELNVRWPTGFSDTLEIYSASDLVLDDWQFALQGIVTAGATNYTWVDADTSGSKRFYVAGNADVDEDNDDLPSSREKFIYKTNPLLADTEGDSMWDGFEVLHGLDPLRWDASDDPDMDGFTNLEEFLNGTNPFVPDVMRSSLPYTTGFEPTESYLTGDLNQQNGWIGTPNKALVQSINVAAGSYAVSLNDNASAIHCFDSSANAVDTTASLYLSGTSSFPPARLPAEATTLIAYDSTAGLMAFDGDGAGGGDWELIPNTLLPDQWVTVTISQNYSNKIWSVSVGGAGSLSNLGFRDGSADFIDSLVLEAGSGASAGLDAVSVQATN